MRLIAVVACLLVLLCLGCVAATTVPATPSSIEETPAASAETPAGAPTPPSPTQPPRTPVATSSPASSPTAAAAPSTPGHITINAIGDIMLARDIQTNMEQNGADYPYAAVQHLLSDADLTIGNFEDTFTERGVQQTKLYTFRTPPRFAVGLAQAGIDLVSLGNNHAMDYGRDGLADTLAALDAAGVQHAGAGLDEASARAPVIVDVQGFKLAFLSYNAVLEATFASGSSAGVARATVDSIRQDVIAAKAKADVVVVSIHGGVEYTDPPTSEQLSLDRAAIDAGASLVLGAHPHVLQGWQRYGQGVIIYSLGNFVFDLDYDDLATLGPRPFQTIVFRVELSRDGVAGVLTRPVFIDPGEDRPKPATPDQAQAIEQRITMLNGLLP